MQSDFTLPNFLTWHCAGCGVAAKGKTKPCDCPTNVGTRRGPTGKLESTWWDSPEASRIKELEKMLADARVSALEEAAVICDDYSLDNKTAKAYECETASELAARIRTRMDGENG